MPPETPGLRGETAMCYELHFFMLFIKVFLQSQKHQDLVTEKQRLLVFLCHHFWIALIKLVYLCIYYTVCIGLCCVRRCDFKFCF